MLNELNRDQAIFLLVEDNADDAKLLVRSFSKAKVLNPVHVVRSGEAALDYLMGTGQYANRAEYPLPTLILLDLKMPGLDGFEVLRWIRQQPWLSRMRVIVLTGSDSMRDVNKAYSLGANSFLIKPADFEQFVQFSQALNGYWVWMDNAPDAHRLPGGPSATKRESGLAKDDDGKL
jgi:CheY-like chemotaxis protein